MKYEEFVNQIQEQIRFHLPEEFADAEITVNQVIKNNDCALDALTIRTGKSNTAPAVYLNPFYQHLQNGSTIDSVLEMISDTYQATRDIGYDADESFFTAYDNVRDKVVCKLINAETNRKFLQDKPYTSVEDLAVIYQILLPVNTEGNATVTITNALMDHYGITVAQLHDQAMRNMDILQPHCFMSMKQALTGMPDLPEEADLTMPDIPMFVLTNNTKVNGAAAILNDSTRQIIAGQVGGDFCILPSSTHEVLIIPKDETADLKEFEKMVQSVNREMVAEEEFLSDHVYEYDSQSHEFSMATA